MAKGLCIFIKVHLKFIYLILIFLNIDVKIILSTNPDVFVET